ncbi:MAG: HAMP domain-containing sensor histidine kinase [Candidatus Omnitrophota bacterium]
MGIEASISTTGLLIIAALTFAVVGLVIYSLNSINTVNTLNRKITQLNEHIKEFDHQAKLIITSDMELKLYQESMEDKLNKLILLKRFILTALNSINAEIIFAQIDKKTIKDLGFLRGLLLDYDTLDTMINIDLPEEDVNIFKHFLRAQKASLNNIAILTPDLQVCHEIKNNLNEPNFLIAAIKTRENIKSIFIVSELAASSKINRAEKEMFTILCLYMGQCLDNISLFEELYMAKDELEKKIKERTNELVKSLREIEQISKLKSDFISSVSHELRTPLTSVKGFSSLLVAEKFGQLPEQAMSRLKTIDENVNKLVEMVNTLLDISRIESGKMEVKITSFDVSKLISDTADFLSPQAEGKSITIKTELPESLSILADRNLIERVLINLINNSIKFTPEGGTITVTCKIDNDTTHAIISIADTGFGISEDNLQKIFQDFFRVDNPANRQIRGSGLGLSLVKRIIDTHKEKIWVESKINEGTVFYFTLKIGDITNV